MPSTRMITVGEAVLEAVIEGAGETVILLPDGSAHVSYLAPLARHRAAWPKRAWRDVWLGGLVTAALFTVGKAVIGYYLRPGKRGVGIRGGRSRVALVYYSALSSRRPGPRVMVA